MTRLALSFVFVALAGPLTAQTVAVPSGMEVRLVEVLRDESMGELWLRFRYVAPRIGTRAGNGAGNEAGNGAGHVTFDVAAIDIDHLCDTEAVPYVAEHGLDPARVVVSMSDRALDFGASDPDATQFFGAYRLENGRCIWEEF